MLLPRENRSTHLVQYGAISDRLKEMLAADLHFLRRDNNPRRQDAVTFSWLGKLQPAADADLERCAEYMRSLLDEAHEERSVSSLPLIVGLTESGIIPSALMHQQACSFGIDAHWVCSTRRPVPGIPFVESHSHGPHHTLPIPAFRPTEIWFVEDEMTTGRTILNLAVRLSRALGVKTVRVFVLVDLRTAHQRAQFASTLNRAGLRWSLYSLVRLERPASPAGEPARIEPLSGDGRKDLCRHPGAASERPADWHFPSCRPALEAQRTSTQGAVIRSQGWDESFRGALAGTLLAVGEAIDLAVRLVQANPGLAFQHVTLSPWLADGRAIHTRLDVLSRYYLYNHQGIQTPVHILSDPLDHAISMELERVLAGLPLPARHLVFGASSPLNGD